MPSEVRIYFEGHKKLRRGFHEFLRGVREAGRSRRMAITAIPCDALPLDEFTRALKRHPNALCLLLVDSECPVAVGNPWDHLNRRDQNRLGKPSGAAEHQAHLMVQIMESWFLADKEVLESYYGKGFASTKLPNRPDIENVPKADVLRALKDATQRTGKRDYHKTAHAPDLLGRINPDKVRRASSWCDRLFTTIEQAIQTP